jgi:hypothetical protein
LGKENSSGRNKPYLENSLSGANPVDYYWCTLYWILWKAMYSLILCKIWIN